MPPPAKVRGGVFALARVLTVLPLPQLRQFLEARLPCRAQWWRSVESDGVQAKSPSLSWRTQSRAKWDFPPRRSLSAHIVSRPCLWGTAPRVGESVVVAPARVCARSAPVGCIGRSVDGSCIGIGQIFAGVDGLDVCAAGW